MNRWFIAIACLIVFAGCTKSNDIATNVQKQAAIDDQKLADFIKANNLNAVHVGAPKTDTIGVYYVIEDPGTDAALYTTSTSVTVSFTAKYINDNGTETQFTSTNDFNPSYVLGATIKGWQLGIQAAKINKGGRVRLLMSSRYAYGPYPQSQYNLPANSILDFDIKIFDVTN
ncbi:FKBP-type peptidyl-prolyl cis-trans isomerase [Mucilaginibacter agri]|uniref:Peptidyl-prolyl cis-trans isomerase n=1 Tax=Mucilaginibacter agri TaxID=2695265 RepID=A0A965ZL08_9SPHI|nr:FKBP-type peptidyl-prolyl cis-trans isomerase [Mucilaginibacter agri]NCD71541.1 hypothetical protein [Mucilaginibacter agri]